MFDSSTIYMAVIGAFFIACGMFVTFSLSRAIGAPSTIGRLTLACVAAIVSSAALATLALISLAPASCSGEHCTVEEGGGFFEGGLVLMALWLFCYSVAYVGVTLAIARYHVRKGEGQ